MSINIQAFSPELCAHLSSLVSGFEGHYGYYRTVNSYDTLNGRIVAVCRPEFHLAETIGRTYGEFVCPAWQVEDVLRNLRKIAQTFGEVQYCPRWREVGTIIANHLIDSPDTAYQKIEEYLWTVLR